MKYFLFLLFLILPGSLLARAQEQPPVEQYWHFIGSDRRETDAPEFERLFGQKLPPAFILQSNSEQQDVESFAGLLSLIAVGRVNYYYTQYAAEQETLTKLYYQVQELRRRILVENNGVFPKKLKDQDLKQTQTLMKSIEERIQIFDQARIDFETSRDLAFRYFPHFVHQLQ